MQAGREGKDAVKPVEPRKGAVQAGSALSTTERVFKRKMGMEGDLLPPDIRAALKAALQAAMIEVSMAERQKPLNNGLPFSRYSFHEMEAGKVYRIACDHDRLQIIRNAASTYAKRNGIKLGVYKTPSGAVIRRIT